MDRYINSHIHLDLYKEENALTMLQELQDSNIKAVIAVSMDLVSCKRNMEWKRRFPDLVKPAFGFHPEQPIPEPEELKQLLAWVRENEQDMIAIGEVGLPYYLRKEALEKGEHFDLKPYMVIVEEFIKLAVELDKPIVLHAVYEDAELVCDLLQKYDVKKAHFHWFKGSKETLTRMEQAS
ncbi:TatD family hydrolase [Brevibacillus daliensis]|uniref:TatD family hydrolase n=1 Tax=Brevibacillus daliensis TaxID=2892995 RepID=UPI001E45D6B1|nr:TatD family hydrolase [Brevibacillus daliensis]